MSKQESPLELSVNVSGAVTANQTSFKLLVLVYDEGTFTIVSHNLPDEEAQQMARRLYAEQQLPAYTHRQPRPHSGDAATCKECSRLVRETLGLGE